MTGDKGTPSRRRNDAAASGPTSKRRGGAAAQSAPSKRRRKTAADAVNRAASGGEVASPPPRIGVISDNHGYLDPEVLEIFAGVTHIIHAGDVMDPQILKALRAVAPVTAVAGNLDTGELAASLPREATGEIAGVRFVVGHKPRRLLKRLAAGKITFGADGARPDLVVWGHLHVPSASWIDGVLHLSPGTASSPDEEDDGPTIAIVEVKPAGLAVCFIPLKRRQADDG